MERNIRDIIVNALSNYDKIKENNAKLLRNAKYFKIRRKQDDPFAVITLFDKNRNKINMFRCEIIAIYEPIGDIWAWSWAIPEIPKVYSTLSRRMLNYGLNMPNDTRSFFIKTELINSRIKISDPIQIDIHLAISSYLTKSKIILPIDFHVSNIDDLIKINQPTDEPVSKSYYFLSPIPEEHLKLYQDSI